MIVEMAKIELLKSATQAGIVLNKYEVVKTIIGRRIPAAGG